MVPFDDKSPFVTSGIRIGTADITTRGVSKNDVEVITELIDQALTKADDEKALSKVKQEVNELMNSKPLFKW